MTMTGETPTYEEVSEMLRAVLLDVDTDLAEKYPDTFERLKVQVDDIVADGHGVDLE